MPLFNPRIVKSTTLLGVPFAWLIEPIVIAEQQYYIRSLSNGSQQKWYQHVEWWAKSKQLKRHRRSILNIAGNRNQLSIDWRDAHFGFWRVSAWKAKRQNGKTLKCLSSPPIFADHSIISSKLMYKYSTLPKFPGQGRWSRLNASMAGVCPQCLSTRPSSLCLQLFFPHMML